MRLAYLLVTFCTLALSQSEPKGEPVLLDGKPVIEIFAGFRELSQVDRAKGISQRLERLAANYSFDPNRISHGAIEGAYAIRVGDTLLMFVSEEDARALNRTRPEAAEIYVTKIRAALQQYREIRSFGALLRGGLVAGSILFVIIALVALVWRLNDRMESVIVQHNFIRIRSLKIQQAQIASENQVKALLSSAVDAVCWLLTLAILFLGIPFAMEFFPLTAPYADQFYAWVRDAISTVVTGLLEAIPSMISVIVIALITLALLKVIRFFFVQFRREAIRLPGFYPEWATPTYKLIRILVIALAVVAAFPYMPGARSPAFQGVSVFLGLLFSLSASGAVANAVSGTILTYMRSLRLGDRVRIGDAEGDVVDVTLLVTRLRTIKNVIITMPNSLVLGSQVINYSATVREGKPLILHTTITIGYDAPWRQVHQLMIDAALATKGIIAEPAPFVFQTALNDFNVAYQINAFTHDPWSMADIYASLHANLQEKFNEAGVEIMSPNYFSLRDGNTVTIPEAHRPPEYVPPGFRYQAVPGKAKPPAAAGSQAS